VVPAIMRRGRHLQAATLIVHLAAYRSTTRDVLFYRAALPLSSRALAFVSGSSAATSQGRPGAGNTGAVGLRMVIRRIWWVWWCGLGRWGASIA